MFPGGITGLTPPPLPLLPGEVFDVLGELHLRTVLRLWLSVFPLRFTLLSKMSVLNLYFQAVLPSPAMWRVAEILLLAKLNLASGTACTTQIKEPLTL